MPILASLFGGKPGAEDAIDPFSTHAVQTTSFKPKPPRTRKAFVFTIQPKDARDADGLADLMKTTAVDPIEQLADVSSKKMYIY